VVIEHERNCTPLVSGLGGGNPPIQANFGRHADFLGEDGAVILIQRRGGKDVFQPGAREIDLLVRNAVGFVRNLAIVLFTGGKSSAQLDWWVGHLVQVRVFACCQPEGGGACVKTTSIYPSL
jgi:hypothetical protein